MSEFQVGEVIQVNGKSFEINKIISHPGIACQELLGTLEGDPIFLEGRRTIMSIHLEKSVNGYIINSFCN